MRIFRARGKETLQGRAGTLQAVSLGSDERIYEDATGFVTQVISVGRHDKTVSVGRHDKTTSVTSFILHIRMSNRDTSKTVNAIDKVAK